MVNTAAGLSLAIGSGLFIGVSFVLKKVGLLKANEKYNEEAGEGYGYLKNAYWWSGMTLMIIGELCNFVAYALVDAILVTPLGALSVVVTTILSAIFLKEKLSFVGKVACFLCIVGSVVIVLNAPQQATVKDIQQMQHFFLAPGFLAYAGTIIVGCVFVAFWVGPRWGKKSMMVYLTICSLIGGLSVVSIQGLGAAVTAQARGESEFNQPFLYVLLVFVVCTLVTEIIFLNKALNLFNAALVTPTYYVYFTSATIVSSAVLFQGFSGTPIQIVTIVLGFLTICSGVVLLQLSKSSKDVPETAVFTGDFNDIRTIAEQEQPESEPKADALRGTSAIIRRISQSRQKATEEEAKRIREDRKKDRTETLGPDEQVEWDGLRRRKTLRLDPQDLQRRSSLHPPLGMSRFPDFDDPEELSRLPLSPAFLKSFQRRPSNARTPGSGTFPRPEMPIPEESDNKEAHEMEHVMGLPSALAKQEQDKESKGKPLTWATDHASSSKGSLEPPTPRSGNKRQFSFQNMFAHSPSILPSWGGSRTPTKEHPTRLDGVTEEERLGLVVGDSNRNSDSDDEKAAVRSAPPKSILKNAGGASKSDAAVHMAGLDQRPAYTHTSSSSPDVRTPGGGRPLPPPPASQTPTPQPQPQPQPRQQPQHSQQSSQASSAGSYIPHPTARQIANQQRRESPVRGSRSNTPPRDVTTGTTGYRSRQGSQDPGSRNGSPPRITIRNASVDEQGGNRDGGAGGAGGAAFI